MKRHHVLAEASLDLFNALKAVLEYEDDRPAPGTKGAEIYDRAESLIEFLETAPVETGRRGVLTCPNTGAFLAEVTDADPKDVLFVLAGQRSNPAWIRLGNGDLYLAVAPQAETYEVVSDTM